MTLSTSLRFRRLFAGAAALAALALPLALASSASAATAGPHFLAPESFSIQFDNSPAGHGYANGPVHGVLTDFSVSPSDDVFTLAFPYGRVNVDHTPVGQPPVNPFTCTGFAVTHGTWQMQGLAGADRHAFGFGRFTAWTSVEVARHYFGCDPSDVISETVFVSGHGLVSNPEFHL
jgi:hypothetical protein